MTIDKRTYDVLIDVWNKPEPWFKFTLPKFARGFIGKHDPWRVAPDDKKKPVHVLAGTRQSLIAVLPEAIAIGSPAGRNKGSAAKLAFITCFGPLYVLYIGIKSIFSGDLFLTTFTLLSGCFLSLIYIYVFKNWLCTPSDWPIIFNRRNRTVTYSPVAAPPFWKFWSIKVKQQWCTASWDEVRARSYKYIESTSGGKSFHDSYNLSLLWGGEGGDPQALSHYVNIGYQGYFEDELMWMLWEHIRRYMEEGGPAIPHGESLRPPTQGKPIVYPSEIIEAAGGPPLNAEQVAKLAAAAPED